MARRGNGASAHGPGQGDGWGGPARGSGVTGSDKPPLFNATRQPSKVHRSVGWDKRKIREERTQELEDMLYDLAVQAEREETRVTAAVKLHAIYNGQPVARNININSDDISDLTDDQLRAELERIGGTSAEAEEGTSPSGLSAGSGDVLH